MLNLVNNYIGLLVKVANFQICFHKKFFKKRIKSRKVEA